MKLFQIEEPNGPVSGGEGIPGAAVGIDIGRGWVAAAVGGNVEILNDHEVEGDERPDGWDLKARLDDELIERLLKELRAYAERRLARPVTHAVIVLDSSEETARAAILRAAGQTNLAVLAFMNPTEAISRLSEESSPEDAVMGAAIRAEEMAWSLLRANNR